MSERQGARHSASTQQENSSGSERKVSRWVAGASANSVLSAQALRRGRLVVAGDLMDERLSALARGSSRDTAAMMCCRMRVKLCM
jgi:hypothetical protein